MRVPPAGGPASPRRPVDRAPRRPRRLGARPPAEGARSPAAEAGQGVRPCRRPGRRPAPLITYVDTSVLIKLVVEERGTDAARRLWVDADDLAAVSLVAVEARAALAAARRGGRLMPAQHRRSRAGLVGLLDQLDLIAVTSELVDHAGDVAEAAQLRGDDAVHLAAALLVGATVMASADRALCDAAAGYGLHVAETGADARSDARPVG